MEEKGRKWAVPDGLSTPFHGTSIALDASNILLELKDEL
jgi:hypothetical protein